MLSFSCLSLRIPSWHAPNDQSVNGPTHTLVGPNKRQCTKIKNNKICFCPVYLSKARPRWQWKSRLLVKQQDLCCKKYFIQFYQCKGNRHRTIINEIYTALHILKGIFLVHIQVKNPAFQSQSTVSISSLSFFRSLRSKRFQSSYSAKVRAGAKKKKKWKGKGEGRRGNACPQTPRFWKMPLDISRFGSFVNWQLVKIDNE